MGDTQANPQVVFITGASQGFGAATARELAERGHQVVATMRNPDRDAPAVVQCYDDRIHPLRLDVTDNATIHAAVAAALKKHGRIDALINNAGVSLFGAVEEITDAELHHVLDVNVVGVMRVIGAVAPGMRERRSGKIINLSSLAGLIGGPAVGGYCASKFALEAITEALRYELQPWSIQVVAVQPGVVNTDMLHANLSTIAAVKEGRSKYQVPTEALIAGIRASANRRQGPRSVASQLADLVEIQEPLPLRVPIGDDAVRVTQQRHVMTDDEWEAFLSSFRDEGFPGSYFRAVEEQGVV